MQRKTLLVSILFFLVLLSRQTLITAGGCNVRDNFDKGLEPFWVVSDVTVVGEVDGTLDIEFFGDPPEYHWAKIDDCTYEDFIATYRCRGLDYTREKHSPSVLPSLNPLVIS